MVQYQEWTNLFCSSTVHFYLHNNITFNTSYNVANPGFTVCKVKEQLTWALFLKSSFEICDQLSFHIRKEKSASRWHFNTTEILFYPCSNRFHSALPPWQTQSSSGIDTQQFKFNIFVVLTTKSTIKAINFYTCCSTLLHLVLVLKSPWKTSWVVHQALPQLLQHFSYPMEKHQACILFALFHLATAWLETALPIVLQTTPAMVEPVQKHWSWKPQYCE